MSVAAELVADDDVGEQTGRTVDPATGLLVLVVLYVTGLHIETVQGIPIGLPVLILLTPLWWRHIAKYEFARLIIGLAAAAIVAGFYLVRSTSLDHSISRFGQVEYVVVLFSAIGVMVAVLWGRALLPLHVVAVAYGLGDFSNSLVYGTFSWKYYLAFPTTVVLVGWFGRKGSTIPAVLALLAAGVATALDSGRSFFAFCALAACVVVWQMIPTEPGTRMRRWTPALLLLVAGAALYNLAVSLLSSGALGASAQARTQTQIETSGSLLLGGRPQWAVTWRLMHERPWGYGIGVVPNSRDYAIASDGFSSLGLDEDGYIRRSMLLNQFRLHSMTADLWVRCGVIGLVLAAVIVFALGRTVSGLIARRECPPIVALMVILGGWYVLFEPTLSYSRDLFFAIGVTLLARTAWRRERHEPAGEAAVLS